MENMQKENKQLEYKSAISKTYLKTVSAFANYNDGEIIFGITDDYQTVGIENPKDACLNIENQINDSIKPRPDYMLRVNDDNTISLFVRKGFSTPYRYNGKAYKRYDSSTIEVDDIDEKRLILSGMNINFEEMNIGEANLEFHYLSEKLMQEMNLSSFNLDTLKSLSLYNPKGGYNNAAGLLADNNDFPGIDLAVFGNSMNVFKKRVSFAGESILKQYYDVLDVFANEYIVEEIEDGFRKKVELIPFDAFREAVANALVHRTWDIKANTKVEMYSDKIVISSPGGLLSEMSKEDYLKGSYSYLRNPIIANVFKRLNIIEAFATGIRRINESYKSAFVKPIYDVTEGAISITLPVITQVKLSANEKAVYDLMKKNYFYSRSDLEKASGFSKDKVIKILNSLSEKDVVEKTGKAKNVLYVRKS